MDPPTRDWTLDELYRRALWENKQIRACARCCPRYWHFGIVMRLVQAQVRAECLERDDGLAVPASTLREWLSAAGLWQRQRRRKLHRRRRPRREHYGELLQMDGSHHDWFDGRRGTAGLMVMIDDATGRIFARFFENESWDSAATTLRCYTAQHGLPQGLYVDRHGIYRADREPTPDEVLAGIEPTSQFGRAMRELDVELIRARSPQAKGRVEPCATQSNPTARLRTQGDISIRVLQIRWHVLADAGYQVLSPDADGPMRVPTAPQRAAGHAFASPTALSQPVEHRGRERRPAIARPRLAALRQSD